MDISILHSADHLGQIPEELAEHCFNDPAWLQVFEKHSGLDMHPCHHLAVEKGRPVGFLPAYIKTQSMCGTLRDRMLGRFSRLPVLPRWGRQNALLCSSPWGFYSGIEAAPPNREDVFGALINHMDQTARSRKLGLSAFSFVPESSHVLRRQLAKHGYHQIPTCPTAVLDLTYRDFHEYVAALAGSNVGKMVRRERKKFNPLTCMWFEDDSLEVRYAGRPLYSVLTELYNNTYFKHHGSRSLLSDTFLRQLWKADHENLRLCMAMRGNTILSFALLRVYRSVAHGLMNGRNYSENDDFFSYFNTVYYEPVIRGIQEQWRCICFRPGVYYAKLKRGCRMENLYMYVKGHHMAARSFLNLYFPVAERFFGRKYAMPSLLNY